MCQPPGAWTAHPESSRRSQRSIAGPVPHLYFTISCSKNAQEHGGACVWVGPLLEYKEHMHKCVDGAAAFIKARLEPMPVTLFCSSIATEPSKDISKSCSKSNPPNPQARNMTDLAGRKVVEARIGAGPDDLQPAKQAEKAPKHAKEAQTKWQEDAQTESAKLAPPAVTKVVLCRHFERLGTCRLGAKCHGITKPGSENQELLLLLYRAVRFFCL